MSGANRGLWVMQSGVGSVPASRRVTGIIQVGQPAKLILRLLLGVLTQSENSSVPYITRFLIRINPDKFSLRSSRPNRLHSKMAIHGNPSLLTSVVNQVESKISIGSFVLFKYSSFEWDIFPPFLIIFVSSGQYFRNKIKVKMSLTVV